MPTAHVAQADTTAHATDYPQWVIVENAGTDAEDVWSDHHTFKAALKEHNEQVHHIPLHRQVIPWGARQNVEVVHRADNWLEWRWITVK